MVMPRGILLHESRDGLAALRARYGEPEMSDPTIHLKDPTLIPIPSGMPIGPLYIWRKHKEWYFDSHASSPQSAEKLGQRVSKNLISLRQLPASVPDLHKYALNVGWSGGALRVEPVGQPKKRQPAGVAAEKRALISYAGAQLGGDLRSVSIVGSVEKGWRLELTMKFAAMSRPQSFTFISFEDARAKIDQAAATIAGLKAQGKL